MVAPSLPRIGICGNGRNTDVSDVHHELDRLTGILGRLRGPLGCPWDRRQDLRSLKPYLLEECHESLEAVERAEAGEPEALCGELGDLLMLVLFCVGIARERHWFELSDVLRGVSDKLVRRHPHVFGGEAAEEGDAADRSWSRVKAAERAAAGDGSISALDGVPQSLPGLHLAKRTAEKAAQIGFDWSSPGEVLGKVREELDELVEEMNQNRPEAVVREIGDLLLATTNLARHLEVDAEEAVKAANSRFAQRFRKMEERARARGLGLHDLDADQLDELWEQAKRSFST